MFYKKCRCQLVFNLWKNASSLRLTRVRPWSFNKCNSTKKRPMRAPVPPDITSLTNKSFENKFKHARESRVPGIPFLDIVGQILAIKEALESTDHMHKFCCMLICYRSIILWWWCCFSHFLLVGVVWALELLSVAKIRHLFLVLF